MSAPVSTAIPGVLPATVSDFEQLDVLLGYIRVRAATIATITASYDGQIAELSARRDAAVAPIQADIDTAMTTAKGFLITQREATFTAKRKSLVLTHGKVGFRKSARKIGLGDEEQLLVALRREGQHQCIETKDSVMKDQVKRLPESMLRRLGVTITQDEVVFVEVVEAESPTYPQMETADE